MYHRAKQHFKKHDPLLYRAAKEWDISEPSISGDLFRDIAWTIVGQQLSSRAADTIFARFQKLFSGGKITAKRILALSEERMRTCGLSGAKTRALKAFAQAVASDELDVQALPSLDDEAVRATLTRVKGIGPWTAEMILMFSLGRPDVFSRGDLGLRKGIMQLYGLSSFPSERKLLAIIERWSPYRTYAARVLWKVADKNKDRVGRKRPK